LSQKAFRDPIHGHISFDKERDRLILDLLSCPEVQRLRRIRQLGVSSVTYPGAEHSRFGHALGACHLMAEALRTLERNQEPLIEDEQVRLAALAAALLHDIGHCPFSHAMEGVLSQDMSHERWTTRIIRDCDAPVGKKLKAYDASLPEAVAKLIEGRPRRNMWISCLIHSQLDVDRMDYLLRDSHYCGVGYGRYDAERVLHTMRIEDVPSLGAKQPVCLEKGRTAVEEYIFSRYYMYWNVYYHPTTRGYEELLKAVFTRASQLTQEGESGLGECLAPILRVLSGGPIDVADFLRLDDNTVYTQLMEWRNGATSDDILRDLSRRFLDRDGLKPIELRDMSISRVEQVNEAKEKVRDAGYDPDFYFLINEAIASAYDYYHPEEESDESSAGTSVYVAQEPRAGGPPSFQEISRVSAHLKGITGTREVRQFCYVPQDCRDDVRAVLAG